MKTGQNWSHDLLVCIVNSYCQTCSCTVMLF